MNQKIKAQNLTDIEYATFILCFTFLYFISKSKENRHSQKNRHWKDHVYTGSNQMLFRVNVQLSMHEP